MLAVRIQESSVGVCVPSSLILSDGAYMLLFGSC